MLKFTYHLVVGVCRAAPTPILGTGYASYGTPGGGKGGSTSRVMRIPIRVYNNVVGETFFFFGGWWLCMLGEGFLDLL